jgi:dihydroorotate dehydrogenase electron transfer subunit
MSAVCSGPFYADQIACTDTQLESVLPMARDTFRIRMEAPEIAARVVPGQFVMIRMTGRDAPLIGRALAVWDVIDDSRGKPRAIDLVFVRKGAMTTPLADAPIGTRVSLWGPLGNGFSTASCDVLIMAAGGVGQTPMLMVAKEALGQRVFGCAANDTERAASQRTNGWAKCVKIVYGARSADLLAGVDEFRQAKIDVQLCSDDGSVGTKQRVPDRLFDLIDSISDAQAADDDRVPLDRIRVVTCGPEIMMQKVAEGCLQRGVACQVSMETPMACGIGICFSCVAMVRQNEDEPWDYKRTCVEGPIFDAGQIVW